MSAGGSPRAGRVAWLAAALVLLPAAPGPAAPRAYTIERFAVAIEVHPDASLGVRESLTVAFQGEHRGLHRTIPLRLPGAGLPTALRIDGVLGLDDHHRPLRTDVSYPTDALDVRVWIPGAVDAVRTVHLLYRVQRALHALGDRDELAWNVTGDGWHVPIRDAEATVTLPPGAVPGAGRAFTGPRGAAAPDGAHERQGRDLRFRARRPLAAGEGFTIVVSWPPGAVAHPPAWRQAAWFFTDHWPLLLPLLVLAAAGLVWRNFGRDPVLHRSVKPEYAPPPGLLPAEGGTLYDQRAEPHDVVATLVDLAVRGYLQIEAVPGAGHDFTVRRLAPLASDPRLAPLELAILGRVFGEGLSLRERRLSELRRDAQYVFAPISDAIYRAMVADRLFPASPFWIRQAWLVAGIAVLFVGGGLLVESSRLGAGGWSLGAGVGASGLVLVGLSRVMPRRTLRGARLLAHLRGFREFLERAEKDRLERLPADTLHRWMPWAIALGVGRMWIGRFGAIPVEPPSWYTARDAFTLQGYEEALADFGRAATEALVSAGAGSAVAAVAGLAGRAAGGGAGGGGGGTF